MKQGKSLVELAQEIERQAKAKVDYVAPTQALSMVLEDNVPQIAMQNGEVKQFGITPTAHDQVAGRLDIPRSYYQKMQAEAPALLAGNVNHWLKANPKKFMVRTLDAKVRALLSDRYRPLDNFDLAETVLPKLIESGCRVESADLTETRLYIKAVTPRIMAEVKTGDVVQAGLCITNSEIGLGAIKIEPLVYRLVCLNGAIVNDMAMRRKHVGKSKIGVEIDNADEYYRDATRLADDKAFWMKVQDVVTAMLDEAIFNRIVDRWREATEQKIEADPVVVVERTAKLLTLTDGERSGVLTHLIQGGDLSAYGLMNAVTRTAQDVESYDRSTDLERNAMKVLELPRTQWRELAQVA